MKEMVAAVAVVVEVVVVVLVVLLVLDQNETYLNGTAGAFSRRYAEDGCTEVIQLRLLFGQVRQFHAGIRGWNVADVGGVERQDVLLS